MNDEGAVQSKSATNDARPVFRYVNYHQTPVVYANDVQISVDPGGVQFVFLRYLPTRFAVLDDPAGVNPEMEHVEVVARVVVPAVVAAHVGHVLPERLHARNELERDLYDMDTAKPENPGPA